MGIAWESHGNTMGRPWEYWEHYGSTMEMQCKNCGNAIGIHMGILWEYHGNTMEIQWQYYGNAMGILGL